MSLKNIPLRLSALKIYKHMSVVAFVLFMTVMGVLSGFAVLTVEAVSYSVAVYPNTVSVGDTVTVSFINTGALDNEYLVGYSLGQSGSITYLNNGAWSSDNLYTFVPTSVGRYWVWCYAKDNGGSTNTSRVIDVLESSEESSEESSFDPMNWMPSNWRGDDYIQPSAESTPDLSYDDLPSDLDAFEVSENLTQIIGKAFNAFPSKLIVLMIPTVICLFIGWWLHK